MSVVATARSLVATLVARRPCGPDAFLLDLECDEDFPSFAPGAFAMLSLADAAAPVLGRPFSIYERISPRGLRFLIQQIGPGTRALAEVAPGAPLQLTAPLGNGFSVAPPAEPVVLVAGGVGSAPFLIYARARIDAGAGGSTTFLYGARSADRLYDLGSFEALDCAVRTATDDGSAGFHGNLIGLLEQGLADGSLDPAARYCACGPEGLLHAFAAFARERGLVAELSLETYMGCGFGVCNACPVATNPEGPLGTWPWARTCTDGPVFSLDAIRF